MSYKDVRKDVAEIVGGGQLPCRMCKINCAWGTLSDLGGMCFKCYRDYCLEIQQGPTTHMTLEEKKAILARFKEQGNVRQINQMVSSAFKAMK